MSQKSLAATPIGVNAATSDRLPTSLRYAALAQAVRYDGLNDLRDTMLAALTATGLGIAGSEYDAE